jgi:hypothetical protein
MQQLLENILDTLCKATSRDVFVMLPSKEKERVPYLIKEIKITLDKIDPKLARVQVFSEEYLAK